MMRMSRYALLIAPSANRVYADAAPRLARSELAVFGATVLSAPLSGIAEERLGGVPPAVPGRDEGAGGADRGAGGAGAQR